MKIKAPFILEYMKLLSVAMFAVYNLTHGMVLSGSTCTLYANADCTTEIKTYTGGSFTISTEDTTLKNYLPDGTENNDTVTLYLKETGAQVGYNASTAKYPVVITSQRETILVESENAYVTTITYGMTINSNGSVDIENTKNKETRYVNGSVVVVVVKLS